MTYMQTGESYPVKKRMESLFALFTDVCFTPPQTPATPPGVPIPYPNTGMAKDTTKGSKRVKISGKEIILKNRSHFSKRQTGHHLVEAAACFDIGRGGSGSDAFVDCGTYDQEKAPSICAEGTDHGTGTHGLMHTFQSDSAIDCDAGEITCTSGKKVQVDRKTNYKDARDSGVDAAAEVSPEANCSEDCLKAQMDAYHKDECKMKDNTEPKAVATTTSPDVETSRAYIRRNKGLSFSRQEKRCE
jgi:hypothetical protein